MDNANLRTIAHFNQCDIMKKSFSVSFISLSTNERKDYRAVIIPCLNRKERREGGVNGFADW